MAPTDLESSTKLGKEERETKTDDLWICNPQNCVLFRHLPPDDENRGTLLLFLLLSREARNAPSRKVSFWCSSGNLHPTFVNM